MNTLQTHSTDAPEAQPAVSGAGGSGVDVGAPALRVGVGLAVSVAGVLLLWVIAPLWVAGLSSVIPFSIVFHHTLTVWNAKQLVAHVGADQVVLIDRTAWTYGLRSLFGRPPLTPIGCLVLTPDEIVFRDLAAGTNHRIPLRTITTAHAVACFRGKSGLGRLSFETESDEVGCDDAAVPRIHEEPRLFRIEFHDESGRENAAAWRVHKPAVWVSAVTPGSTTTNDAG